ncbi:hypothetical protein [Maribacter sp. 2210JD10-5]|uniref:Kelch repeat-containing protein n=1 Tax=Maribacter sp. 2210JD10-5 TaxID=3386272 RepID=UPI0039BD0B5B
MEKEEKRIFSWVLFLVLILLVALGCNKNDDPVPPKSEVIDKPNLEPDPQNRPPGSFGLMTVTDGAENVNILPTLSWEQATDPDGDQVTYDLLMGVEEDSTIIWLENLTTTSVALDRRLKVNTTYYWKILAKDDKNGSVESNIFSFTTRDLRIPSEPSTINEKWIGRKEHSTVVFNDELWAIGGVGNADDSFVRSTDGVTWQKIEFDDRNGFSTAKLITSVVFRKRLWVIGGQVSGSASSNPVWSTDDGVNWIDESIDNENEAFYGQQRFGHTTMVFNDKLWVIGGVGTAEGTDGLIYLKDAWVSEDGKNWERVADNKAVFGRTDHTSVIFDDKLWVILGLDSNNQYSDEIWYTEDGQNWIKPTGGASLPERFNHTSVVFDDVIWVIEGLPQFDDTYAGIWYSKDGTDWKLLSENNELGQLANHSATVFREKIWVIGGEESGITQNGVWVFD